MVILLVGVIGKPREVGGQRVSGEGKAGRRRKSDAMQREVGKAAVVSDRLQRAGSCVSRVDGKNWSTYKRHALQKVVKLNVTVTDCFL
jgi:hypothetical protein